MDRWGEVERIKVEIHKIAKCVSSSQIQPLEVYEYVNFSGTKRPCESPTSPGYAQLLEKVREILFLRWLLDELGYSRPEDKDVHDAWLSLKVFESQCAFYPLHESPECFPREKFRGWHNAFQVLSQRHQEDIASACRTIMRSSFSEPAQQAFDNTGADMPVDSKQEEIDEVLVTIDRQGPDRDASTFAPCDYRKRLDRRLALASTDGQIDEVRFILDVMGDDEVLRYVMAHSDMGNGAPYDQEVSSLLLDTAMKKCFDTEIIEKLIDRAIEFGSAVHVKELLKRGASTEGNASGGWSRLAEAVQRGHLEVSRCLIEAGADLNAFGICDITPLMLACSLGDLPHVKLLLDHGANPHYPTRDTEGFDIMMYAATGGNPEIVKLLLEEQSCGFLLGTIGAPGSTAFGLAVERGHWEAALILLEEEEASPRHYAGK